MRRYAGITQKTQAPDRIGLNGKPHGDLTGRSKIFTNCRGTRWQTERATNRKTSSSRHRRRTTYSVPLNSKIAGIEAVHKKERHLLCDLRTNFHTCDIADRPSNASTRVSAI